MDCRRCPGIIYIPGVIGRYECGYTGCQICPEDLSSHRACPACLRGSPDMTVLDHEARAILTQVAEHGRLRDLLTRYTPADADALALLAVT